MKIQRRFTQAGIDPLDTIEWDKRESVIREPDGTVVFEMRDIEVPKNWSQVATDILAQKYFRKAGVPQADGSLGRETSARQVVRRLAGCWTDWGRRYGYFDSADDAAAFDAEMTHMLANQMAAPNSPQWFNTGLNYAYGINGPAQGHYYVDPDSQELVQSKDAYTHPQPHACLPYDAPVNTPDGPISIGMIVDRRLIGLEVYDETGTTKVVAVKDNGIKPVYRVTLENGDFIEATGDHLVRIFDQTNRGYSWNVVNDLAIGSKLVQRTDTLMTRFDEILKSKLAAPIASKAAIALFSNVHGYVHQRVSQQSATHQHLDVVGIELVGNQHVYDIQTESHSFLTHSVVVHNCFIQSVEDDLVNDNGIMDLWVREARLFKYGSGCISERAFVPIVGRGLVRIGDLFKEVSRQRPVVNFDGKGRYVSVDDLHLKTLSLDRATGKIVEDPIDFVWSYDVKHEDKLTVRFDTGASATVSAWHPFMVWDGSDIVERRADALKRGDTVIGPNSTARDVMDAASGSRILTYAVPWFRRSKLHAVIADSDIAWLTGYFLGDGSLGYRNQKIQRNGKRYEYRSLRLRFFDEDREPLKRVARILSERFGAKSSISADSRGKCLILTCVQASACGFFAEFIHAPGSKGDSLRVPEFVRCAPSDIQLAFLAGLVDSDGTVASNRALFSSQTKSFVEEIAAISSLLGIGGGIHRDDTVWTTTVIRKSTSATLATRFASHLATPKHARALESGRLTGRRKYCLPLAPEHGQRVFASRDKYGLHGFVGDKEFHIGRLEYEGIINPTKLTTAIAEYPGSSADPAMDRLRLVAEGIAFVTEVSACVEDVPFNDLTTRSTNTYLAGENGLVVIHNTGTNFSNLRGEGEKLSGGGTSSGLMSFLRVGDRAAGAIKSGGTTRRAAKMVILDMDHPDIEKFINWKVQEEKKVAALMAAGYDGSYEGEAYQTVSGQNSNNSVRVSDAFIDAVRKDGSWDLLWRKTPGVARTVRARDLWDQVGRAAWACADPGVQYDDIINSWHTCPAGGRIRASNPCSEYMFLDDTACNLASINLMKFFDAEKGQFDVESYRHAIRLWTVVLEISVLMAQFPSPEIARKSYQYRTLGLGYANLGTLLMVSGIPYDSPRALAISGALSAILTGESYATSADMASQVGPFPKYQENSEHMLRVMRNHRRAAYNAPASEYEEVSVVPMGIDQSLCPPYLLAAARDAWDRALELGEKHGYRNAQATCIAPTGCLVGGSLVVSDRGLMRLKRLGDVDGDKWQDVSFSVLTDEGERQATKFYVNGVESTRRIKTENGYSIQGTPSHRIKVVNPTTGQLEWKRFADVQPGDITALSMGKMAGSPNVVQLPPLGEEYWTGDYTTRVPRQMSESLAELVGYFMGDGSFHSKGLRFCVSAQDTDVVRWLTETIKELFNVDATVTPKTGYMEVAANSVPLTMWWEACGFTKLLPRKDHSGKGYSPRVPDAVLASNNPLIYGGFLRGLFEADGTVTAGVPCWSTVNAEFCADVKSLMLVLGLPTTTRETTSGWGKSTIYVLRLRNKFYVEQFEDAAGFLSTRKSWAIVHSDEPQGARRDHVHLPAKVVDELVPAGHPMRDAISLSVSRNAGAISRRSTRALAEESGDSRLLTALEFFYDRVTTNEDAGEQLTYDISVPENLTYIANGFISHNTIGLQMDCDTTGIEPDFALVKFKKLSGGGYFKIINQSIPAALRNFGYTQAQIEDIIRYAKGSGSLYGAPYINHETLRARGLNDEDLQSIEKALPTVFELGFAFNHWALGEATLQRLGFTPEQYTAQGFDLVRSLGFSRDETDAANDYICGTMTIEGAPHLKEEHYAAFDCANKCGKKGKRFIHHMGHVRMMAAAQPHISGALSKTINLPNEATIADISEAYMRSWDLGLKSIALYRDGSKLSQPLSNKGTDNTSDKAADDRQLALSPELEEQLAAARKARADELGPDEILAAAKRILANATNTDFKRKVAQALERNRLPAKRRGWTQKAKIAGHTVFLRTGEYADGTLGEIFVDLHKEGASFRSLMNCFAIAVSIGLQYGVPLEEFVEKFTFTRFEPNGFVDHPNVKYCTSVIDYIFRVLGMEYLGRTDFVQVKPEDRDVDDPHHEDHVQAEFDALVSAQQAADEAKALPMKRAFPAETAQPKIVQANIDPSLAQQLNALRSQQAQLASMMGDAPLCDTCGSLTRRNGACYVCDSCGRSMGCS